ncbi:zf-HC2 domain-containing protein [Ramlibacter sp. RBP-2]|uniref:Zf-HC2 domain-containing protein n=1 Tax=Ramlibacter lithotrophicus TaxID=2606681 RepID=A0A7X6DJY9_9BURK|nr:zf-HC2 domain-containing protein [Ramlibacter lithotrophicus]NKE68494.1 zf-HC2 domain-containing protein [Ramlibacter lithotrophicus]
MNDRSCGCPRIEDISAFIDGALAQPAAGDLARHAQACALCGAALQELRQLHEHLQPLRARRADVDIAALVMPQLRPAAPLPRRRRARRLPALASLWQLGPRALGGAAALGAGVYLGLALLAGSGAALRPAGMTVFDAEPAGALCAGLPSCSARGR